MKWIRHKYFRTKGHRHWVFSTKVKDKNGVTKHLELVEIAHTPIQRHVKIQAAATPFDPAHKDYFRDRQKHRKQRRLFFPPQSNWSAWWELDVTES